MVGFKSFAERTRLEFQPGVTAIIGPNGCGKSNVVDAIRWCLGEMSAKSLRSKVLTDVIFNGASNRAPTNMSEVSLTFDNAQRRLPIDYSEVTISRRLFRSGESEYYLNKTQCRLKDIKELFLDTGIGEEGYSIMEQGRVEYILNARPEDRRELFEEAAGVSKYKARREEALRKMDRTQIDLDRLADVITMTKEQMDKLEAAVRKARQYQKLRDELKSIEIAHWSWEMTQLDEELKKGRVALQAAEDELQRKTTSINQLEARASELRVVEIELGEKLVSLNRQLSDIDGLIGLAEQRHANAKERIEEIKQRDAQLDAELTRGEQRLKELEILRETVSASLQQESRIAEEMTATLLKEEETYNSLQEKWKSTEKQSQTLQDELWNITQQRTQLHNDITTQRSLAARLETELKVLQKDRLRAEEKIRASETSFAAAQTENAGAEKAIQDLETAALAAKQALDASEENISQTLKEVALLQEKYFSVKAQYEAQHDWDAADLYAQGAHALVGGGRQGIHGPVGKLISVAPSDEAVVRRLLGAHLNDLLADNLEDAQAAVNFLAENKKGRARLWVMDRLPAIESRPAANALGQRSVSDMIQCEPRFRPAINALIGRWISSGNTLYGDGVLEGGADFQTPKEPDILRMENLQREMLHMKSTLDRMAEQKSKLESQRQAMAADWEKARHELESVRARRNFQKQEEERQKTFLSLAQEEVQMIDVEIERVIGEERKAQEEPLRLQGMIDQLSTREENLRRDWQAVQGSMQAQQQEAANAGASLAAARERAGHQDQRVQWQQTQLNDADAESQALSASQENKRQERSQSQQKIEEQERAQQESLLTVDQQASKRQEVERALEELQGHRQSQHQQVSEVESALAEIRETTEQLRQNVQDKRIQISHAEVKLETTETHMKEKYQLSLQEAVEIHGAPTGPANVQDLERLRRRVEGVGPVNLAAPEEHTQLEERYNFLLTQQQDLLKAKEDLMQTIQKINATTRENFRETFHRVRENFKTLYGQLFQGGEADLRFTDENDMLNTGIEIYAQPPGKKLLNITLLSGGEKALTAVSLLFAFFMVRPSPFCILDEVDAPLDEANVTRFITLLRAFTHQSQFIMITHNKRSMETADTLYGVTMETLGVSNILSARLKKEGSSGKAITPESVLAGKGS